MDVAGYGRSGDVPVGLDISSDAAAVDIEIVAEYIRQQNVTNQDLFSTKPGSRFFRFEIYRTRINFVLGCHAKFFYVRRLTISVKGISSMHSQLPLLR